jgi:isopropylmalate/homocitrate/citramalate synthase
MESKPWYVPGKWYTSPLNWEPAVRSQMTGLPKKVHLRDVTMREGEETVGAIISPDDRPELALKLDELGIGAIELPKLHSTDAVADLVKTFRRAGVKTKIAYFSAKLRGDWKKDIDRALRVNADILDLHFSFSPLEIFSDFKEGISKDEIQRTIEGAVPYAVERAREVAFGWSKTTRTNLDTVKKMYGLAAQAGASHLHVYDSRGSVFPTTVKYFVQELKKEVGERSSLSIHCHNDFGLATANTLAAVEGGADWCEVAINGLGDRAGNASLEEVAASLQILFGIDPGLKLEKLYGLSKFAEKITGVSCQRNKAITGENAFLEESASHMLQVGQSEGEGLPEANVPFVGEVVGQTQRYVWGSSTFWGNVLDLKVQSMGLRPTPEQMEQIRKDLYDEICKKRFLTDKEVETFLSNRS